MGYTIATPLDGIVRETIISALLAADLKAVPLSARYLGSLAKEKRRVLYKLQEALVQANICLEPVVFEADNLSSKQIFRAIQQYKPDTAEVVILHNRKLRESVSLVERVLNMIVCFHYSRIITQLLLHIEFLDEQIQYVSDEIESGIASSERPSVTWRETFALVDNLPDIDQPTTMKILAEAGFSMDQYHQERAHYGVMQPR
jgi:hypothetical protein